MEEMDVLAANPHGDFNGGRAALRDHADLRDIADCYAFERDRGAAFESAGVVEVRAKGKFFGEQAAACRGHEEDDEHQNRHGRQDQCANSQLGPLNLFAARHAYLRVKKPRPDSPTALRIAELAGVTVWAAEKGKSKTGLHSLLEPRLTEVESRSNSVQFT